MLNPAKSGDRLDYSALLAPPFGYELAAAVGTTYSLDLEALTGACMALGLAESADSVLAQNSVFLLEALRTAGDKIALFCQAGQIKMPKAPTPLYVLLEKVVFEVMVKHQAKPPQNPSFHPKFWIIKYEDTAGNAVYRVIVLSRNLSFDRSWDVAVMLEGVPAAGKQEKSAPLVDFLEYLLANTKGGSSNSKQKRNLLRRFMEELPYVAFSTGKKEFPDFDFIPVGVPLSDGVIVIDDYHLFKREGSFHELLVMSPFLSQNVIDDLNTSSWHMGKVERVLITRRSELEKLHPENCDNFSIYTMKDEVLDGEDALAGEDEPASTDNANEEAQQRTALQRQDIHAKLYMRRKSSDSELFLGSLNASHSALNGNVEFMLRLGTKNRYLNLESLKKSLFGGKDDGPDNPFTLTALPETGSQEKPESVDLDRYIRELYAWAPGACVKEKGDAFAIGLTFAKPVALLPDVSVRISPLLADFNTPASQTMYFEPLSLSQLSEFFCITASQGEERIRRVIKVPTRDMPEGRDQAVVREVIKDTHAFYQYIAFLMGDDALMTELESRELKNSAFLSGASTPLQPMLYERLLRAAATNPERFAEIDYLLAMVASDDVVPEDFAALYKTFKKAVNPRG